MIMVHNKDIDYAAIGKRLKDLRRKKEVTQEQLAERADITPTYLSNIENAHSKASLPTFIKIANGLECGVDELLCDNLVKCRPVFEEQFAALLDDCDDYEVRMIIGTIVAMKNELRTAEALKRRIKRITEKTVLTEGTIYE
jgi:transcriptional regulator with XRE-family HTH domain